MKEGSGRDISIGDLSRVIGVSEATIRSWEDRYGWPRPTRTRGLHRRYKRSELPRYRAIAKLRRRMTTKQALDYLSEP